MMFDLLSVAVVIGLFLIPGLVVLLVITGPSKGIAEPASPRP